MKQKNIMTASFEKSLNLSDDNFIKYMIEDTKERKIFNGKSKIGVTLISIFLIGILYVLAIFSTKGIETPFKDSPVPQPTINFLPIWLFGILLIVWFAFWGYSSSKSYLNEKMFANFFNAHNFLIWIVIEANLLFLTFFLKSLTIIGIIILFGYTILISKKQSLEKQLFNIKSETNKVDNTMHKIIHYMLKYGWLIILLWIVWKFIFPNTDGARTDMMGFIGIVAMWIAIDIGFIVLEAYLFLPYLLYGYYRYKYPEEYRDWEGKTQIEWYGEKYFNKHIKGTEKEEKIND
ncbi:DUF4176 domain-containing protein [Enterococcus quebecensis]|uniref:Uncharacterized protein n=1 Tax=Enterococcus quebecensis TaxID=903983 RepID=A0A1E5GRF2_9ENTE|nr:hypothetical protein [Enterococcus quebecensis]OEG15145.1 hypothetical protein BCR23_09920 [Enterococcus quebecensis]OJG74720.1 membrane protein [Enterococcus quebecensis]